MHEVCEYCGFDPTLEEGCACADYGCRYCLDSGLVCADCEKKECLCESPMLRYCDCKRGGELSEQEREFLAGRPQGQEAEGAYTHIQRTKPQTLSYALNDSPAGLAAWIVEKWRAWSDCDGEVERRFSKDELLTNLTIYWATETIGSSFRVYRDWALGAESNPYAWEGREEVPRGVASTAFFSVADPRIMLRA